jgi:hypothetical protein
MYEVGCEQHSIRRANVLNDLSCNNFLPPFLNLLLPSASNWKRKFMRFSDGWEDLVGKAFFCWCVGTQIMKNFGRFNEMLKLKKTPSFFPHSFFLFWQFLLSLVLFLFNFPGRSNVHHHCHNIRNLLVALSSVFRVRLSQ